MIVNEIDKFRNDFFDKLIKEERQKEKDMKLKQARCNHNYNIMDNVTANGYQQRQCSKCYHTVTKSMKVWAAHGKQCVIS
jgi:hypothetical protein